MREEDSIDLDNLGLFKRDSVLKPFRWRAITRTNFQSADFPLWTPSCALLSLERGFDESVFKGSKAKLDVEFIQDILKRCLFCPFKICVVLSDWDISKISQNHLMLLRTSCNFQPRFTVWLRNTNHWRVRIWNRIFRQTKKVIFRKIKKRNRESEMDFWKI